MIDETPAAYKSIDAVMQAQSDLVDVVQKGYRLGDRVLRPARVVVAAGRQEEAEAHADADR